MRLVIRATALIFSLATPAHALDLLRAEQTLPATPAGTMTEGCLFSTIPTQPLPLSEAIERALCGNPKTHEAWADIKAQAAAVGVARAAYLPKLSGNWQGMRQHSQINIQDHPTLSSDITSTVQTGDVSWNWLLYDFGAREATLKNAHALLAAARATQDATLQAVFAKTAKDYYAAQAAMGAQLAAQEVERTTQDSMTAAQTRVERGIAPITDALQAQTQHEEAIFNLTKAEGETQSALGTLAADMDMRPDAPLQIPPVTDNASPGRDFNESVSGLINQAKENHPAIRAAQAQYEAAQAKADQTRAQGWPSLSNVAKYTRNNQPQSLGLGLATYPATGRNAYLGVQLSLPLFEGYGRHYQIHQAEAQAERQAAVLEETRQQIALDVWNSYQTLTQTTRNAQTSATLQTLAQHAWDAARHRYDTGVGTILELMSTQATLANARQRHIQALADWNNAKVDLAAKLGRLGAGDWR